MVDAIALINGSDGDDVQMQKPKSATRVVGQVLGGALLLLSGVAIGRQHPASLRGSGLGFISEPCRWSLQPRQITRGKYRFASFPPLPLRLAVPPPRHSGCRKGQELGCACLQGTHRLLKKRFAQERSGRSHSECWGHSRG